MRQGFDAQNERPVVGHVVSVGCNASRTISLWALSIPMSDLRCCWAGPSWQALSRSDSDLTQDGRLCDTTETTKVPTVPRIQYPLLSDSLKIKGLLAVCGLWVC